MSQSLAPRSCSSSSTEDLSESEEKKTVTIDTRRWILDWEMFLSLGDREGRPLVNPKWRLERREVDEDCVKCQWIWESTAPTCYRRSSITLESPFTPCRERFIKTKTPIDLSRNTTQEMELLSDLSRRLAMVHRFIQVRARHYRD